jgi:competence protein ComEC
MATKVTFHFLDVGMGDGTLVIMGEGKDTQIALIDLGVQPFTKFKVGAEDALRFLTRTIAEISHTDRGLPEPYLDHLFITHPDQDHYNRIPHLVTSDYGHFVNDYAGKTLKIGRTTYGGAEKAYGTLIGTLRLYCSHIDTLGDSAHSAVSLTGEVEPLALFVNSTVRVYLLSSNYPRKSSPANPTSLCLMFENDAHRKMIFLGDAEGNVEAEIISNFGGTILKSTGLKLGHHGSQAGTTVNWLNAVKPEAVFASGDMVWSHPYCDTLQRVIDSGYLATGKDRYLCCGGSKGEYKEYFNKNTKLQIGVNLWYVVKEDPSLKMKSTDPEDLNTEDVAMGVTMGVQWAMDFEADGTVDLYHTDTQEPAS